MRCTVLRKDGVPCRAKAVLRDPDSRCLFHSNLTFPAKKKTHEATAQKFIVTLEREVNRLRKMKDLPPLQRASEIRNLIELWISLNTPVVEPLPKPPTFEEKLKKFEEEGK